MRYLIMFLPWLELFTLIKLGVETTALTALAYVLATFVLGILILQYQGREMMEKLRQGQAGTMVGPQLLLDDMAAGFSGVLLMIPGMITDFLAIVVAIGPVRRRLMRFFSSPQQAGPDSISRENVRERADPRRAEDIEGTFHRVDED